MKVCIGSAGRFWTFELARQMERQGYLASVYTGYPKWKVNGLPRAKVRSFPWLMGPKMLLGRWGLHGLEAHLNRVAIESFDQWMSTKLEACDVFHCLASFGLYAHRVAKERHGAVTICDRGSSHILYQDEVLAEEFERWRVPYRHIDRHIVNRELQEYEECDLIFVPSSFAHRSFVQKRISEKKLAKIHFGVDLKLFHPIPKDDDVFRVIYVGGLSLRKGIPYLLEAVAPLRLSRFEVWLIGGLLPEARSFLTKYDGCYRYLGAISRAELYKYYSQGSVLVIPSVEEGLALVQAQAMACGLPVIATMNTGAEDLFTDGAEGFIVPIRNHEAIREKVVYLYEHPNIRDEFAKAALQRVQNLNGWNSYGEQVTACYRSALARLGERNSAGTLD